MSIFLANRRNALPPTIKALSGTLHEAHNGRVMSVTKTYSRLKVLGDNTPLKVFHKRVEFHNSTEFVNKLDHLVKQFLVSEYALWPVYQHRLTVFVTWVNDYYHGFLWDVIYQPCHNVNDE